MRNRFLLKLLIFLFGFFLLDRGIGLLLTHGLERYFGLSEPCEVLCIGNSNTVLGIDKPLLEHLLGKKVAVYARQGADLADREIMLRQYFDRFPNSRPLVVLDVSERLFNPTGLSENSFLLFYPFLNEAPVYEYIRISEPRSDMFLLRVLSRLSRYNDVTLRFALRGLLQNWTNLKTGHLDPDTVRSAGLARRYAAIQVDPAQVSRFRRSLSYCDSIGVPVDLLFLPRAAGLTDADTAGYERTIKIFTGCAQSQQSVSFMNYSHLFPPERPYFFDPIHLNAAGQEAFTRVLAGPLRNQLAGGTETPN